MAIDCEAETNGRPLVMALPKGLLICGVCKVTVERGQKDKRTDRHGEEGMDARTDEGQTRDRQKKCLHFVQIVRYPAGAP